MDGSIFSDISPFWYEWKFTIPYPSFSRKRYVMFEFVVMWMPMEVDCSVETCLLRSATYSQCSSAIICRNEITGCSIDSWYLQSLKKERTALEVMRIGDINRPEDAVKFYYSNWLPGELSLYSGQSTGWTTEESSFDIRQEQEIFIFSKSCRPASETDQSSGDKAAVEWSWLLISIY